MPDKSTPSFDVKRLLQHATGEAKPDLDRVMSTLSADPRYIAWGAPADLSSVGREAVQASMKRPS
jgi:hypothetical protein